MSSLMQFNGKVSKRGVALEFYQTRESDKDYLKGSETCGDITDFIACPGGKVLPRIWTAERKPAGMFGCWVLWRVNGETHSYDLSCPIGTFKLPRDAKPMPIADCVAAWAR